jgi:hypothetical protein
MTIGTSSITAWLKPVADLLNLISSTGADFRKSHDGKKLRNQCSIEHQFCNPLPLHNLWHQRFSIWGQSAEKCTSRDKGLFDKPPHPSWFIRNGTSGAKMRDGSRKKLALKRLPGRWVVSEEAIREFIEGLTAARPGEPAPANPAASASRERQLSRVDAELESIGIS